MLQYNPILLEVQLAADGGFGVWASRMRCCSTTQSSVIAPGKGPGVEAWVPSRGGLSRYDPHSRDVRLAGYRGFEAWALESQALLQYDPESREVRLAVDRAYRKGEAIYAWCGPQPNRRLFLNYGIVDESSPYDNLAVTATLPSADPLFQAKRHVLQLLGLSTQQSFSLLRNQVPALPPSNPPLSNPPLSTHRSGWRVVHVQPGCCPCRSVLGGGWVVCNRGACACRSVLYESWVICNPGCLPASATDKSAWCRG